MTPTWAGSATSVRTCAASTRKHLWSQLPIIVVIDDGNGYRSMYAHFGRIVVKRGQEVRAGQLLGYEGATGRASGCHVHYGLFSPLEQATFAIKPDVAKRMKLPRAEIARIDPLLVLPPKHGINAPKASPKASPEPEGLAEPEARGDHRSLTRARHREPACRRPVTRRPQRVEPDLSRRAGSVARSATKPGPAPAHRPATVPASRRVARSPATAPCRPPAGRRRRSGR